MQWKNENIIHINLFYRRSVTQKFVFYKDSLHSFFWNKDTFFFYMLPFCSLKIWLWIKNISYLLYIFEEFFYQPVHDSKISYKFAGKFWYI